LKAPPEAVFVPNNPAREINLAAPRTTIQSPQSAPFRALVAWDLLRLRGWVRLVGHDRIGLVLVLGLFLAGAGAAVVGAYRLGRMLAHGQVFGERILVSAGLGGAGLALIAVYAQARLGRRLDQGPLDGLPVRPLALWTLARTTALALLPLGALLAGADARGTPIGALLDLCSLAGFAVGAVVFTALLDALPPWSEAGSPSGPTREQPNRLPLRLGLWSLAVLPLRGARGGLPAWSGPVLLVLAGASAARLCRLNGSAELEPGVVFATAVLTGPSMGALDADLFAMLARTRQPLARLVLIFALPPAAFALVAGLIAALVCGGGGVDTALAALIGALAIGAFIAVDALNLAAFGPTGAMRTLIYAALAAILAQAIGPVALLIGIIGFVWLWRLARRRRWSEL
jgi:hypothetical protein